MEATITQSGALYLAQRNANARQKFFDEVRRAARKQQAAPRRLRTLLHRLTLHADNGR